ncbi:MAG: glycosyltransferase [Patescibacteria group bacterium]|nr:glycosyltransferase [Patescibacteria group bacterium]
MKYPKVSVIITTKNEENNIGNCLASIKKQIYKNIEIIVVDNNSTDKTKEIAKKYTNLVFDKGPERSAQRNFGAQKATGEYVLFLDADMVVTPKVVEECVRAITNNKFGGIIIPEESFGTSFWAKVKALERSFYVGNDAIEAARFYKRDVFNKIGGFDESITGPEDWDFSQRIKKEFALGRISAFILHNEGKLSLIVTMKKKFYYAKKFNPYLNKNLNTKYAQTQINVMQRNWIFLSHPSKLFKDPVLGAGVLFLKTAEFGAGAAGFLLAKFE